MDTPKGSAHSLRELDLAGGLALVGAHLLHHSLKVLHFHLDRFVIQVAGVQQHLLAVAIVLCDSLTLCASFSSFHMSLAAFQPASCLFSASAMISRY